MRTWYCHGLQEAEAQNELAKTPRMTAAAWWATSRERWRNQEGLSLFIHFPVASSFSERETGLHTENGWTHHQTKTKLGEEWRSVCWAILGEFGPAGQGLEAVARVGSGFCCQEASGIARFLILQVVASMSLLQREVPDYPKDLSMPPLACELRRTGIISFFIPSGYPAPGTVLGP